MENKTSLLESREAVLQTAIEILQKLGGKAKATQIYEEFGKIIGHDLDETQAANVYSILTGSNADACLLQKNGQCLYINSANDQTFTLETNMDKTGTPASDNTSMNQALNQPDNPTGYTPLSTDQAKAVVEPDELVKMDSAAGKIADDAKDQVQDVKADATALIDEAKADKDPGKNDRRIDGLSDKIDREDKKIQVEEDRIKKHEEQIAKDRTKLMKDLHEAEIHHDQKVIERAEAEKEKLEKEIID